MGDYKHYVGKFANGTTYITAFKSFDANLNIYQACSRTPHRIISNKFFTLLSSPDFVATILLRADL